MRKFLLITAALALVASTAFAAPAPKGEKPPEGKEMKGGPGEHHGPGLHHMLNNVIKVTGGEKTALCVCGMEVKVTDKTPTFEHRGMTIYTCSEGCKEKLAKATPDEMRKLMGPFHEKLRAVKYATNEVEKGGKKVATCACGKTFDVTDQSPSITENGVRMYCCSAACEEHLMKMPAAERAAAEAKVVGKS